MAAELYWDDAEEIGLQLAEKFPHINPLEIRFVDLKRYVIDLPTFRDNPDASDDGKLEAIQNAWNAEYFDRKQRRVS
jgi:FeS assembly protein IscX